MPDVRGRARLGGIGTHRLCHVMRSADRLADRMARADTAGGDVAGQDRRAPSGGRRSGARTRGRDENPLRSQVPAVTAPAWVEHVIWWQVYPLGFVGAFPAAVPPDSGQHRLRRIAGWFDHAV